METNPFSSKTTDALKRELLNVTEMLNEKRRQQASHQACQEEKQKALLSMEKLHKEQVKELEQQVQHRDDILKKFNGEWKSL